MSEAPVPQSHDFFCVIERADDDEDADERSDAVQLTVAWGDTAIATRVFTRPTRAPLAAFDLGLEERFEVVMGEGGPSLRAFGAPGEGVPVRSRVTVHLRNEAAKLTVVAEPVRSESHRAALLPDSRTARLAIAVLFAFPMMSSVLALVKRDTTEVDVEAAYERVQMMRAAIAAADAREAMRDEGAATTVDPNAGDVSQAGGTGARRNGEEGAKGDPSMTQENGVARVETRRHAPARVETEMEEAKLFGMVTLLARDEIASRAVSAFANENVEAARGGLTGDAWSDSFGAGSAGLSGVGEGGGGKGAGIGLSNIGGLGRGVGNGTSEGVGMGGGASGTCDDTCVGRGQGFGRGHGRLGVTHHYRTVSWGDEGLTQVNGRLPPEAIQRIVRQNFGRLRACYETGLERDPSLEGRVAVKFVIDRSGAVAVAELDAASTTLSDAKVTSCVVAQYTRMTFPQPEGGIVTVVYPVVFEKG
jgi:hypothetical protein